MPGRTSKARSEGRSPNDEVRSSTTGVRRSASTQNLRIGRHPILTFEEHGPVSFIFEGRRMTGRQGETIAAALAANGVRLFRHAEKTGRPRGFFCAVGKCASCLMVVDGRPNTMVCMEPLREGVKVERQSGRGRLP
jgi:hypothetical protein